MSDELRVIMADGEWHFTRIATGVVFSQGKSGIRVDLPDFIADSIIADHAAVAALREALEAWKPIIEALKYAEGDDRLSTFKVAVPKDGYPQQYLMDYLPTALLALRQPASPEKAIVCTCGNGDTWNGVHAGFCAKNQPANPESTT